MTKQQFNELITSIRCIANAIGVGDNSVDSETNYPYRNKNRSRYRKRNKRNIRPSQVVPNETYTIRELFERATVGSMPEVARPFYAEDTDDASLLLQRDGIDLSTLDLVELQEYKDSVDDKIKRYNTTLEQIQANMRKRNQRTDVSSEHTASDSAT